MSIFNPAADVGDRQFLHESRKLAVLLRPKDQMPVIGHQTESAESHRRRLDRVVQDTDKRGVVRRFAEKFPSTGGAVQHMANDPAGSMSELPGHGEEDKIE